MLKHLTIKNYALIDSLDTDFFDGFSVMTGETGAGKSIILGALSLILGQRADLQSLRDKSAKCIVEGVFAPERLNPIEFFEANNLDYDPEHTILRREILPSGKSRAFINDTPVSLVQLRELGSKLVDIHSQNTVILLQDPAFQLGVVDNFGDNEDLLTTYYKQYKDYHRELSKLEEMREEEARAASEQDFLKFQYEELNKASLRPDEQEDLENELEILTHAEEIKTRLSNVNQLMDDEHGLNSVLSAILSEFKPLKDYSGELSEIYGRIESNYLDLNDLSREIVKVDDRIDVNPGRLDELNNRLNHIYHLQQKHRVKDIRGLLDIKDEYLQKINDFTSLEDRIREAEKAVKISRGKLAELADQLSVNRNKAKPGLEKQIRDVVAQLGMPNARISLDIRTDKNRLTETGCDNIVFLFNANKGGELMEMSKIASGGEMSRLMLAIKSQIASRNLISTIIFDEIDSGVSGEIAGKMAGIMQQMADELQIISITHLPQIAARGRFHYLVNKVSDGDATNTSIQLLSQKDRITEIAKMLSDATVSNSALQTAEELMKN